MGRVVMLLVVSLFSIVSPASAIQLHWSTGSANVSFTDARRCTLVVEAEQGHTLPADWHLVWVAENDSVASQLVFSADPSGASNGATVCQVLPPANPAEAAGNTLGARFCDAPSGGAATARLILDASAGTRAKLQVVGFVPSGVDSIDGTTVRSSEVTLNGGSSSTYPPVVFRATSSHHLGELNVRLAGANLAGVTSVPIAPPDTSWNYTLDIVEHTDSTLSARADIAAPLPALVVAAATDGALLGTASLPPDSFTPLEEPEGICAGTFEGSQDTTGLAVKDFTFVVGADKWHIFYTRQYSASSGYTDQTNQRMIGHATTTDPYLNVWTVQSHALDVKARDGRIWDNLHVYAPYVFRKPGDITYYMFYTGVQLDTIQVGPPRVTAEIQRIGIAKSVNLNSWAQDSTPVYFNKLAPWTFQDSTQNAAYSREFRDPFVMADPDSVGRYLLYFVSVDSCARISGSSGCSSQYVVGVGRTQPGVNASNLRKWQNVGPLVRTSQSHMRGAARDESPHAFFRRGNWWLLYTSNGAAPIEADTIVYTLNASSPASLDTTTWRAPALLKSITCGEHDHPSALDQWHATEYFRIASNEYLSAWSDALNGGTQIQFSRMITDLQACPTDTLLLNCPGITAVGPELDQRPVEAMSLELAGASPIHELAPLRLVLRDRQEVHVAVYDVFGRRVKTLFAGVLPAGPTTITWDGRIESGALSSSGIYFARATYGGGRRVVRIALIH